MVALTVIEKENQLLIDFLEGDAIAYNEFPEIMMPRILKTARAIARDIPEDIREEIAQQTFQNLLFISSTNFNPERGTAWQFLIGQILNAEKQVRAAYGYPQRRKKKDSLSVETSKQAKESPKVISIDTEKTDNLLSVNFETTFESEFFARTVIRKAPKSLASALKLICFQDNSKEQAARAVGLTRFQLHRQISKLRSQLMAA